MSNYIEVIVIVEGKTEQIFVESILAPYLGYNGHEADLVLAQICLTTNLKINLIGYVLFHIKNIGMKATQVSKPGQKGGDVRFSRVKKDLRNHLKQRSDTYISTFVDYYGIKEWLGYCPWGTDELCQSGF